MPTPSPFPSAQSAQSAQSAPPQAVILAAGTGSRLGRLANGKPKCLLPIRNRTLLEIQIDSLLRQGVQEVCVVAGYRRELIEPVVDSFACCSMIVNPVFADTNSLYSLWLTRDWLRGAFACTNADVVAHPEVYRRVLHAAATAVGCDRQTGHDEEQMKIEVDCGRVVSMSKNMPAQQSNGENVGLVRFDQQGYAAMLPLMEQIIAAGGHGSWVPAALNHLAVTRQLEIEAVDVTGLPWTEIDFPEDLAFARREVWPLISPLPATTTARIALR